MMKRGRWLNAGDMLRVNAVKYADKEAALDKYRSMTFKEWNERVNKLGNAMMKRLGLKKGDHFAVLSYNCVEWFEIYAASAKTGLVTIPVLFRLAPPEMEYVINHSEAKAIIVQDEFVDVVNSLRDKLPNVKHYIYFSEHEDKKRKVPEGYIGYEELIDSGDADEPGVKVDILDPWVIMYTGGTTGLPKGVIKSHMSLVAQYLISIPEHEFEHDDRALLVLPLCHINSLYYSFVFTYIGGTIMAYNMRSFDPEDLLRTMAEYKITFTSLVPTHYIMILSLPDEVKKKYDVSCVKKLLISSAPARRETKLAIMDFFKNSRLWEAYGSTEAGIVTILKPHEQFTKLGSIGREVIGSDLIKLYDENGNEITEPNKVGELYSRSPMLFDGYWKNPEKTEESFIGEYFSAGDMAYRDEDGYYYLVDRKANMIITGGENVYPSEVEKVIGAHPAVKDVAVVGLPHEKWGEAVTAVVILHEGKTATAEEIREFCRGKIAGYKIPKDVIFIKDEEMPRSAAGKILHRKLRERYKDWYMKKEKKE